MFHLLSLWKMGTLVIMATLLCASSVLCQSFSGSGVLVTGINNSITSELATDITGSVGPLQTVTPGTLARAALSDLAVSNVSFVTDTKYGGLNGTRLEVRSENPDPDELFPARIIVYHVVRICCWNGPVLCCTDFVLACFRSTTQIRQWPPTADQRLELEGDLEFDNAAVAYTISANGSYLTITP